MSRPIVLYLVTTGGDYLKSIEISKRIAEKNYEIVTLDPRQAKLMGLKPNDDIVQIMNWIPETHQYYPHTLVEPNRRTRRKQARQNKRKK
jgi:hypothetical protein